LAGIAGGFLVTAVALRLMKPCPCAEQLGEADASAEAVAMASAIVDRGRIIIVDPPLTFDTPKTGVPATAVPGGQSEVAGTSDIAGAAAARISAPPEPVSFGPVVLTEGAPTRAPRKRTPK